MQSLLQDLPLSEAKKKKCENHTKYKKKKNRCGKVSAATFASCQNWRQLIATKTRKRLGKCKLGPK